MSAEILCEKNQEQLRKKEEQYCKQMEEKQQRELMLRTLEMELRTLKTHLKEVRLQYITHSCWFENRLNFQAKILRHLHELFLLLRWYAATLENPFWPRKHTVTIPGGPPHWLAEDQPHCDMCSAVGDSRGWGGGKFCKEILPSRDLQDTRCSLT